MEWYPQQNRMSPTLFSSRMWCQNLQHVRKFTGSNTDPEATIMGHCLKSATVGSSYVLQFTIHKSYCHFSSAHINLFCFNPFFQHQLKENFINQISYRMRFRDDISLCEHMRRASRGFLIFLMSKHLYIWQQPNTLSSYAFFFFGYASLGRIELLSLRY